MHSKFILWKETEQRGFQGLEFKIATLKSECVGFKAYGLGWKVEDNAVLLDCNWSRHS